MVDSYGRRFGPNHWSTLQPALLLYQSGPQLNYKAPFCLNFSWLTPCLTCNMRRHIRVRLTEKCWSCDRCYSLWLFVPLYLGQLTRKSTRNKPHVLPIYLARFSRPTKNDFFRQGSLKGESSPIQQDRLVRDRTRVSHTCRCTDDNWVVKKKQWFSGGWKAIASCFPSDGGCHTVFRKVN